MAAYAVLGLVALGVAIGISYYLEWHLARQRGEELKLTRHPLGVFALAAERLSQAKYWLRWLLALWAVSLVLAATVTPWLMQNYGIGAREYQAEHQRTGERDRKPPPESLEKKVFDGVQLALRLPSVSVDAAGARLFDILVPVALGIWLLLSWRQWAGERRLAIVPAVLLIPAGALYLQLWFPVVRGSIGSGVLDGLITVVCYLLFAGGLVGQTVIMCHLMLRVAQGKPTTLRTAAEHMSRVWAPFLVLSLIDPIFRFLMPVAIRLMAGGNISRAPSIIRWMYLPQHLVYLCLIFYAWVVMTHGPDIAYACRRNFELIGRNWRDIIVFGLRYMLIVQSVAYAINWHRAPMMLGGPTDPTAPWRDLAYHALVLVPAIAGVIWYLELDRTTLDAHRTEAPSTPDEQTDPIEGALAP